MKIKNVNFPGIIHYRHFIVNSLVLWNSSRNWVNLSCKPLFTKKTKEDLESRQMEYGYRCGGNKRIWIEKFLDECIERKKFKVNKNVNK